MADDLGSDLDQLLPYGFAPAQFNLGLMSIGGTGVLYDYEKAIHLFKEAARKRIKKGPQRAHEKNIDFRVDRR